MVRTIRKKMILLIVPAVILVLVLSTLISLQIASGAQRELAFQETMDMSRAYAHDFNTEMKGNFVIPQTLANALEVNTSLTRPEVLDILHQLLLRNPQIVGIDVGYEPDAFDGQDARYANTPGHDATGRFLPYWNRLSGKESLDPLVDMDTADWYTIPRRTGKNEVIEPYFYGGILMASYISPIEKNGTFRGIVGMDVTLQNLDAYVSKIRVYKSGYAFLVTNGGTFLACPDKMLIGNKSLAWLGGVKNNPDLIRISDDVRQGKEGYVGTVDPFTGKNVVMFYSPIQTGNWSMVVVAPSDEMLATTFDLGRIILLIGFFSILLVGGIVVLVARNITAPIIAMTKTADQIAAGNLDVLVPEQEGEPGVLAHAFNNMTARLRELILRLETKVSELETARAALAESEEKYRMILENIQDVFYRSDPDGNLVMASPSWAKLLGYDSVEECLGRNIADTFYLDPEERRKFFKIVEEQQFVRDYEVELKKKDGSTLFVSTNSHLYYDRNGAVAGIEGIFRDISERRQSEQIIHRKNEELNAAYEQLAATNKELRQNFDDLTRSQQALDQARKKLHVLNRVTFEDIRNALFSLSGFLALESQRENDEVRRKYHEKQVIILKKTESHLTFAQAYQDLGINPPRWQNVNQVFLYAISHLDLSGIDKDIRLGSVEIFADPLLEKVFLNLADNVRRHGGKVSRISFSFQEVPDGLILLFEDNGSGIPEGNKEAIFTRGDGKNKGIGLYFAREILAITGIRIRECGIEGAGAQFEMQVPPGKFRYAAAESEPDSLPRS